MSPHKHSASGNQSENHDWTARSHQKEREAKAISWEVRTLEDRGFQREEKVGRRHSSQIISYKVS